MNKDRSIKIIPLGGLDEIGKNMTLFQYGNNVIIIDCGSSFPDEEMYGVDLIIPDITYLKTNDLNIQGIFITHGHEDHIGALPYFLKQFNVPVYGTAITIGLIRSKLIEHKMDMNCNLNVVNDGDKIKVGDFTVEFIRTTHSIAGACALAIHTPIGVILHTGDFKVDYTPIDNRKIDLERIGQLGKEGILVLMADSTNVERKGHTMSERTIGETFNKIFANAKGKIIVATFASNIHRIQQIIDASIMYKRKIAFSGRSMERVSQVAIELGYLHVPDGSIITLDNLSKYNNDSITIITTGSQGEPMAALARIAFASHKYIKVENNDLYIISASPIPGNDKMISKVINELFKKGAEVIYEDLADVHVSGHAYRDELKLIHTLAHPKYFVPVHGEYRHMKHHSDLAESLGMDKKNIVILQNGDVLNVSDNEIIKEKKIKTGNIYVDGLGVGDVGNIVLRDRRNLASDGMITIIVVIDKEEKCIIAGPDIITRGFVYVKESEDIINSVKKIAREQVDACLDKNITEWYVMKTNIKQNVERNIYEKTKRHPSIFPVIMEI